MKNACYVTQTSTIYVNVGGTYLNTYKLPLYMYTETKDLDSGVGPMVRVVVIVLYVIYVL